METNDKELSPQESLELIHTMINKTKDSVADNSFYFLLWGWLVFFCCMIQFILNVFFQYPNGFFIWLLMPVGGIISGIYGTKQSKKQKVKSIIGESISYLWLSLFIGFITLVFINAMSIRPWQTALTYYILLYGIGTFATGRMLRFQPLVIGGLINFVLAAVSVKFSYDNQLLIGSAAILISYIIPGHLLRMRHQHQKI